MYYGAVMGELAKLLDNNTAASSMLTAWVRMWMGAVNFFLVFFIEMPTWISKLPDSAFTLLDSCIYNGQ